MRRPARCYVLCTARGGRSHAFLQFYVRDHSSYIILPPGIRLPHRDHTSYIILPPGIRLPHHLRAGAAQRGEIDLFRKVPCGPLLRYPSRATGNVSSSDCALSQCWGGVLGLLLALPTRSFLACRVMSVREGTNPDPNLDWMQRALTLALIGMGCRRAH